MGGQFHTNLWSAFWRPKPQVVAFTKKCNLFVGMQEWYIIPREVDFMVSENIHTHPTVEVHSHVAAPSNWESPFPQASKKGKVVRGLPPVLFFFLGWGRWDVGTHRLKGSLKRKSKSERLTFLKDNISLGKWDSLTYFPDRKLGGVGGGGRWYQKSLCGRSTVKPR